MKKSKTYLSSKKAMEEKIGKQDNQSGIETYFHTTTDYPTQSISSILEQLSCIKIKGVSKEILEWLIENVENFIDNKQYYFQIDLVIDEENKSESVQNIKLLQTLYRSIPEGERDSVSCREKLNNFTQKVLIEMQKDSKRLEKLFKRMGFYYEMKGIGKNGEMLIQELAGSVAIVDFVYEAFSMGVRVKLNDSVIKEAIVPESFSLGLEIAFNSTTSSLF